MNRLTDKTSVEFNPECSKVNPLTTSGKCPYYDKLAELENFMEEQGYDCIDTMKKDFDYIHGYINALITEIDDLKQKNRTKTGILFLLKDVCNNIKDRLLGLSNILDKTLKNDKDFGFDNVNRN